MLWPSKSARLAGQMLSIYLSIYLSVYRSIYLAHFRSLVDQQCCSGAPRLATSTYL